MSLTFLDQPNPGEHQTFSLMVFVLIMFYLKKWENSLLISKALQCVTFIFTVLSILKFFVIIWDVFK